MNDVKNNDPGPTKFGSHSCVSYHCVNFRPRRKSWNMNLDYYSLRFKKLESRRILSTKLGHFQGILHLALGIPASLHLQGFASFLNNEHPDSSFAVFLRVSGLLDGMAPVGLSKLWDGNCMISKRCLEAIKNHENNESKNRSLCLKGLL